MLEVKNLNCFRSNQKIISDLSFDLNKGEVIEILGKNGSGKTTLLRSILGLTREKEGLVNWKGVSIKKNSHDFLSHSFYQGHSLAVKTRLTVVENIVLNPYSMNREKSEIKDALARVGLKDKERRVLSQLSIGQRKRVSIARWILSEAEIFLIDEPFSNLDEEGSNLIKDLIEELTNKGCSFLLTGHKSSDQNYKHLNLD